MIRRLLAAAATVALLASPVFAADSSHLQFVQEYIRELNEQEALRAQSEAENKAPNGNTFMVMIHYGAAVKIALTADVTMLQQVHLGAPFDAAPQTLIQLYNDEIQITDRLSDSAAEMLEGPKPNVDYGKIMTQVPKLRAALEANEELLPKVSFLAFVSLIDTRPDAQNHLSRLIITRQQRAELIQDLQRDFGEKLEAKNQNGFIAAAGVIYDGLHKSYKYADDP